MTTLDYVLGQNAPGLIRASSFIHATSLSAADSVALKGWVGLHGGNFAARRVWWEDVALRSGLLAAMGPARRMT
jgi:hypothetical protein